MQKETVPFPENADTRLEIEHRNPLQAFIIKEMLQEKAHDRFSQEDWAARYGKKISDIIDVPEHEDIRILARAGNYQEAAKMVIDILEKSEKAA